MQARRRTHWQKPSRILRASRRRQRLLEPTPSERSLGRRALPAPGRGSGRRARTRDGAQTRARRRVRRDRRRPRRPSTEWKVNYALLLGLERVLSEKPPRLASGTELRRHQIDALAGMLTELIAAVQKSAENGNGNGNGNGHAEDVADEDDDADDELGLAAEAEADEDEQPPAVAERPGRGPPLPLPPSDRVGQDDRRGRLRRGRAHRRRPDPHAPPPARRPVPPRAHRPRLRRALPRGDPRGAHRAAPLEPDHDPDVRVVRAARRRDRTRRVPARDLRRGAHGARREDVDGDPPPDEPVYIGMTATEELIAKQVSDVFPASVDDLPLTDAARRGLIAPLRCLRVPPVAAINQVPIVGGDFEERALAQALDHEALNMAAATLYRERFGDTPGDRVRGRRRPRVQPRDRVPRRRDQGGGGVGPHAAREAGGDPRRLRARRDRRADQRDAARRRLELAARDRDHAPRADGVEARLPAAHRPHHAHPPAQGSGHRRRLHAEGARRTTSASSRCTRCSTRTSTARAHVSRPRRAAASSGVHGGSSRRRRGSSRSRPTCCAARW